MVNVIVSNSVATGVRDFGGPFRMGGNPVYRLDKLTGKHSVYKYDPYFELEEKPEPTFDIPDVAGSTLQSIAILNGELATVIAFAGGGQPGDRYEEIAYADTVLHTYQQTFNASNDLEFRTAGDWAAHVVAGSEYIFVFGVNLDLGLYSPTVWVDRYTFVEDAGWSRSRIHEWVYTTYENNSLLQAANRYWLDYHDGRVYIGLHAGQSVFNAAFTRIITEDGAFVAQTSLYGDVDGDYSIFARGAAGSGLLIEVNTVPGGGNSPYYIVRTVTGGYMGALVYAPGETLALDTKASVRQGIIYLTHLPLSGSKIIKIIEHATEQVQGGTSHSFTLASEVSIEDTEAVFIEHDGARK